MFDTDALADYTQGRLGDDEQTERVLARSLAEVRRWCGWHVAPVITEQLVLDGPIGQLLRLPTLNIVSLTAVTEDGEELDLADLEWSALGLVRKTSGGYWSPKYRAITVDFTHGYTAEQAADFEQVVFSVADRMDQDASGGVPAQVGPFRWNAESAVSLQTSLRRHSAFTSTELSVLEMYRLEPYS